MIKIDIFSGFLGAGKTTLIKKLIKEAYAGEKIVLIENEFGEIGVDGGFLQDAGIEIKEMNSGCICCSLVGDFSEALKEVAEKFHPDRIVIEPSGVGKLSDVIRAVERAQIEGAELNAFCTVVDAKKCKLYLKNFGEFFLDQVKNASCVVLSHTVGAGAKVDEALALLKENTQATVVTTNWDQISGEEILSAMEQKDSLRAEIERLAAETEASHEEDDEGSCHHHHHDDDDDGDEECCHHHHHHDGECCHHHEEGECHHDNDHDHEHHHHHHNGHDADEVFTSWGVETAKIFSQEELENILKKLDSGNYGEILRAKGIVNAGKKWLHFDYLPEEVNVREGSAIVTGRLCVIGCHLKEDDLKTLFLG